MNYMRQWNRPGFIAQIGCQLRQYQSYDSCHCSAVFTFYGWGM